MSHSPNIDPFIVSAWEDALKDAAVAEADSHLIACPGAATEGWVKAVSFRRHDLLVGASEEGGVVVGDTKLAEANQYAPLNRVAIFEDWDEGDPVRLALLSGLLRHEIEHGLQRDLCPNSFALYDATNAIINLAVGDERSRRELFHTQPVEWDANAAASIYLRQHPVHQQAVADLLDSPDAYLVRSQFAPSDPQTLVTRTVAFLYSLHEATLAQAAIDKMPVDALLDAFVVGAGELWRELDTTALC